MAVPAQRGHPAQRQVRNVETMRRKSLLTRVRDVVLDEGFSRLTTDELCARFQCSKATLYAIAPAKDELIATAIEDFLDEIDATIETTLSGVTDPVAKIALYLHTAGDQMRSMSPVCYRDMITHPPTRELYRDRMRRRTRWLRQALTAGMTAGVFRAAHLGFLTTIVTLVSDAIEDGEMSSTVGLPPEGAYTQLSDLILAGLTNSRYQHRAPLP